MRCRPGSPRSNLEAFGDMEVQVPAVLVSQLKAPRTFSGFGSRGLAFGVAGLGIGRVGAGRPTCIVLQGLLCLLETLKPGSA